MSIERTTYEVKAGGCLAVLVVLSVGAGLAMAAFRVAIWLLLEATR